MTQRKCTACGETKPLTEFSRNAVGRTGYHSHCKVCRSAQQRERRREQSQEERNAQMAAYRAGMRKDRCAVCSGQIKGHGICSQCERYVSALGGLDGLKRAAKAVKWLQSQ